MRIHLVYLIQTEDTGANQFKDGLDWLAVGLTPSAALAQLKKDWIAAELEAHEGEEDAQEVVEQDWEAIVDGEDDNQALHTQEFNMD
jgi:hypothetical protein